MTRLRVYIGDKFVRDYRISCAPDTTVTAVAGELLRTIAREIKRISPADSMLDAAKHLTACRAGLPTMLAWPPEQHPHTQATLLDPRARFITSGIRDGWSVWLTGETAPLPTPATMRVVRGTAVAGTLTVLTGKQRGAVFALVPGENLLGRQKVSSGCAVPLTARSVSREHAKLTISVDAQGQVRGWQLTDLGSVNGTRIVGAQTAGSAPNAAQLMSSRNKHGSGAGKTAKSLQVRAARAAAQKPFEEMRSTRQSTLSLLGAGTSREATLGDVRVRIRVFTQAEGGGTVGTGGTAANGDAQFFGEDAAGAESISHGTEHASQGAGHVGKGAGRVVVGGNGAGRIGAGRVGGRGVGGRGVGGRGVGGRGVGGRGSDASGIGAGGAKPCDTTVQRHLRQKYLGALPTLPTLNMPALPKAPAGLGLGQQLQGLLVPLVCGMGMLAVSRTPAALVFALLAPLGLLLVVGIEMLRRRRTIKRAGSSFFAELAKSRGKLMAAQAEYRKSLRNALPPLEELELTRERLWELPPVLTAGETDSGVGTGSDAGAGGFGALGAGGFGSGGFSGAGFGSASGMAGFAALGAGSTASAGLGGAAGAAPPLRLGLATIPALQHPQLRPAGDELQEAAGKRYARLLEDCKNSLAEFRASSEKISGVPCMTGSRTIGVCGAGAAARGHVRALAAWLAVRLAPAEVCFAALTSAATRLDWEWLLWLPHSANAGAWMLPERGKESWGALFQGLRERAGAGGGESGGAGGGADGGADGGGLQGMGAAGFDGAAGFGGSAGFDGAAGFASAGDNGAEMGAGSGAGSGAGFGAESGTATDAAADAGSGAGFGAGRGAHGEMPWLFLVVDTEELEAAELATLFAVARASAARVTLVWLAQSEKQLPGICETRITWKESAAPQVLLAGNTEVELQQSETLTAAQAERFARRLAPWRDAAQVDEAGALPAQVSLAAVHSTDLRGGSAAVGEAWRASDSLPALWRAGAPRRACPLRVPLGRSARGVFHIDLRRQGPHALLAGTTGAGKSEFLQTWLLSLAASLSPARLTFLLVDYKGGAAFAECGELPHTVGLVSDLTPALARRALVSLRAELRFRERVLAEFGCKDVLEMEHRGIADTPPVLLLVVDEFAALSREIPEFVTGILDVAQRGRSLGIHLVLATQRPAGVVNDSIRANTNLRIALRVADAADSRDVVGSPLAAEFGVAQPGRAIVRCGSAAGTVIQTAYVGGPATGDDTEVTITRLDGQSVTGSERSAPDDGKQEAGTPEPLIQRVCRSIRGAASALGIPAPRPPWLAPLPAHLPLPLSGLLDAGFSGLVDAAARSQKQPAGGVPTGQSHAEPAANDPHFPAARCVFGVVDIPDEQCRAPLTFTAEAGNIALIGASGTGKTTALRTLAAVLSAEEMAEPGLTHSIPPRIYALSPGHDSLHHISVLPTVRAIAALSDETLPFALLHEIREEVRARTALFAQHGVSSLAEFRSVPLEKTGDAQTAKLQHAARIVFLLDDFHAFRDFAGSLPAGSDNPLTMLSEIMQRGPAVGVQTVVTALRPFGYSAGIGSTISDTLFFRLADQSDYQASQIAKDLLQDAPAGRCVSAASGNCIQVLCLGENPSLQQQTDTLHSLAAHLQAHSSAQLQPLPEVLPFEQLAQTAGGPTIGLTVPLQTPCLVPGSGTGVVSAPQDALLQTGAEGISYAVHAWQLQQKTPHQIHSIVFPQDATAQHSLLAELQETLFPSEKFEPTTPACDSVLRQANALAPHGTSAPVQNTIHLVLLRGVQAVQDAAATQQLCSLLELASDSKHTVLLLVRGEGRDLAWEVQQQLRQLSYAVAVRPFPGTIPAGFSSPIPEGTQQNPTALRGWLQHAGKRTPFQLALCGEDERRVLPQTLLQPPEPPREKNQAEARTEATAEPADLTAIETNLAGLTTADSALAALLHAEEKQQH